MASPTMHVEVVSAEGQVLSADVSELYARSVEGEFGLLPGHQPAVFALDIAPVHVRFPDGSSQRIAVHRGTLFVDQHSSIIVLADIAELEADIDVDRAQAAKQQLEDKIAADPGDTVLRASLAKQNVRLQVAAQPVQE